MRKTAAKFRLKANQILALMDGEAQSLRIKPAELGVIARIIAEALAVNNIRYGNASMVLLRVSDSLDLYITGFQKNLFYKSALKFYRDASKENFQRR